MKKIFLTVLSIVALVSCQTDESYENLNRDPKNPTQVDAGFLFNAATKSLYDQMTSTNVNTNIFRMLGQHWTETTYTDEANYDFNTRNIPQNHWSEMYRDVLLDLTTAREVVDANTKLTAAEKSSRDAQIEVLMIFTWAQLVETYGDIPYSQALSPSEYVLPAYDKASVIYTDLLARLTAVIPNITGTGFGTVDPIYGGNAVAWKKFANSLLLRMGLRVVDVPAMSTLANSAITTAVSGGVFTSNSDNASLAYESATPNTNPLWVDLVQSGRSDFVAANTLVNFMNGLTDPRRASYFDQNLGAGVYTGGPYGANNSFSSYSHVRGKDDDSSMHDPAFPACLMDYAEVCFYLADAAERSISGTPAAAGGFYNAGITASFNYWGTTGVAGYLAQPNVNYATATGTYKQKIGNQLWIAMYNRGFEAWTAWRVYDTPTFNLPAVSGLPVPTRYTYPVNEQNLNESNWTAASTSIGGDNQTTKLFFDVN